MITQGYLEPVRVFASRIDQEFRVRNGAREQTEAFLLYRRITKIKWLVQGVRPEILDYIEPSHFLNKDDLSWIEFVEAVQDAEWLYLCENPKLPVKMWYDCVPRDNPGNFGVDSEGYAVAFTAGACSARRSSWKEHKGGIGVWFKEDHKLNVSETVAWADWMNNFAAEIAAVIMALSIAKTNGLSRMAVVTDSTFVSFYVQTHIPKWLENGWKRDDGELVKNRRQYRLLLELMENIAVKWVHIKDDSNCWDYHYGIRRARGLAISALMKI